MRARAIREGSVGLLILVGIGLFGGLVLWLRGLTPGGQNYSLTVSFENTSGMQIGAAVRYRGVRVGRVVDIKAGSNEIDVLVEITQPDLRIPKDVIIEANQSGFIGETTIDITPRNALTETEQALSPLTADCDSSTIVCAGDRLEGMVGVSYESLLRSTETLADTLSDPVLVGDLKTTLKNAALFTERATVLTDELTTLTLAAQEEVAPLSDSVQNAANSTAGAADSAAEAARTIQLTAADAQSLIAANQFNITNTLGNLNQGSDRLVFIMDTLATEIQDSEFLANLETLSANAAEASFSLQAAATDIQQITGSVNQPENLLLIQQTLESARDVFQSAQKILSDVDELTGDPEIRNRIRDLINGLGELVSSTQLLEQQVELANTLAPLRNLSAPLVLPAPSQPVSVAIHSDYQELQNQIKRLVDHNQLAE